MGARPADELEQERRVALAHAGHVDHVQRGAGRSGVGDHLVERRHAAAAGRVPASLAQVHEAGDAVPRGDAEHVEDLLPARARRVFDTEPDAERAIGHSLLDQAVEPRQVRRGERAVRPAARRVAHGGGAGERLVMQHEGAPRPRVADRDAVVDQGAAFARRIPGGHRVGPDFELQGRGDAVVRVVAVALGVLAVGVEVDESGGDHEAAHVQRLPRGG